MNDRGQDRRAASEAAGTIYTAAEEIEQAAQGAAMLCDIREEAQVAEAVARTVEKFGGIDSASQCQRHPAHRHAGDRHEALRPDAPDQHARHVPVCPKCAYRT